MDETTRQIYQQIPGGLALVNRQGTIEFANNYLEMLLGYSSMSLEGIALEDVLPECGLKTPKNPLNIFNNTTAESIEKSRLQIAIGNDGSVKTVEVLAKSFPGESSNRVDKALLSINDATVHQEAIESLNLSQAINKTATWSFDLINNIVWWSPELFRIFNLPVADEAPPYETHQLLFSKDSWSKLQPAVAAAAEQGLAYELELQLAESNRTAEGKQRYAVARCEPQLDDSGNVVRLVGTFQDVSSLKHTQLELEETLLRLQESITAGGIGLWDWDLTNNKVRFSNEYKRQLGYAVDELDNHFDEWKSRVHQDDIEETMNKVKISVANCNQNHEVTFRMRHRDGTYRWILSHARVITNATGKAIRMLGSHLDITEQRKLENQLRHSQKMESIGQLAGGVAHDFNNQLASIMGFAELISASDDIAKIKKYVQRIFNAAEVSGNLTRKLLTFSRQDNLKLEPVNMHELINETIELLSHSIDKRIAFQYDREAEHVNVMGDKSLLQNALLNLGVNAKDAMPEGGLIKVSLKNIAIAERSSSLYCKSLTPPDQLQIEFADTGYGISEQHLNKIFDPFYTTKAIGSGTGLGLASVYGTIQQMHGTIDVESEEGKGTRFIIWLPLNKGVEQTKDDKNDKAQETSLPKTILVVDDEPQLRQICKDFLEVLGHHCLVAENGHDAIRVYQENQQEIELVIMDMIMPGMNGKDAFEELKKLNPNVKVIISSGFTADNATSDLLLSGVKKVIGKPFKLKELENHVNEIACQ